MEKKGDKVERWNLGWVDESDISDERREGYLAGMFCRPEKPGSRLRISSHLQT